VKDESPFEAVERVLNHHNVEPNPVMVMMLIEAVRDTTPPPQQMTIGLLRKLLISLEPHNGLEAWAVTSAREISTMLAKDFTSKHEHAWCAVEGVLTAMLIRVTRGDDLTQEEA
jgi:hypothetical protein